MARSSAPPSRLTRQRTHRGSPPHAVTTAQTRCSSRRVLRNSTWAWSVAFASMVSSKMAFGPLDRLAGGGNARVERRSGGRLRSGHDSVPRLSAPVGASRRGRSPCLPAAPLPILPLSRFKQQGLQLAPQLPDLPVEVLDATSVFRAFRLELEDLELEILHLALEVQLGERRISPEPGPPAPAAGRGHRRGSKRH
jgi:hypothetical protein